MRLAWAAAQYRFQPLTSNFQFTDHQGNVRMTFTTKDEVETTTATLENAAMGTEGVQFLRYGNARRVYATLFDRTNGAAPGFSQRLNGSANEKQGLARSLAVVPGDKVNIEVYAKYVDPNSSNWNAMLTTLMGQINAGTAGVVVDGAGYSTSSSTFPYGGLLNTTGSSGTGPKAFLNWLIFDKNFVYKTGGYVRITGAARETGTDIPHERLQSPELSITEAGYVYIYLSNEETTPVEVYFDDFKVVHTKSPVVQSNDHFAFGMGVDDFSYQRENSVKNKFVYNGGSEQQTDINANLMETFFRGYDASIGRFMQMDPLSSKYSSHTPYNYGFSNPILFIDPMGAEASASETQEQRWKREQDEAHSLAQQKTWDAVRNPYRMYGIIGDDDINGTAIGSSFAKFSPGDGGALKSFLENIAEVREYYAQQAALNTATPLSENQDILLMLIRGIGMTKWHEDMSNKAKKMLAVLTSKYTYSSAGSETISTETPWVDVAFGELYQKECSIEGNNLRILEYFTATNLIPIGDKETAWCAAFANWCLMRSGIDGTGTARAQDFSNWGQKLSQPAYGAFGYTPSHVGMIIGVSGDYAFLLGGNQSNQVKVTISYYRIDSFTSWSYPIGYTPTYPDSWTCDK